MEEFNTWCLSRRASAPVTSLASSSEDTSPRMPLIQDIKSLCTDEKLWPKNMSHTAFLKFRHISLKNYITTNLTQWHPPAVLSPEVREEALKVVGVAKFVFALVSTSHQAAPGSVQLSAFLLDVIYCLRVGLDQTLCCLPKRVHLGREVGTMSDSLKGNNIYSARGLVCRSTTISNKWLKDNLTLSPRAARSLSKPSCLRCRAWTLAKSWP